MFNKETKEHVGSVYRKSGDIYSKKTETDWESVWGAVFFGVVALIILNAAFG
jgi:hypothetical protein